MLRGMGSLTNAVCFTCGLVIESPARLNRLTNGQVCPACRERVLDGLPSALPWRRSDAPAEADSSTNAGEHSSPDDLGSEPGPDGWDRAS